MVGTTEATGGAIGEILTIVGKEVGTVVQELPISKLSNKAVEDLSITTGAATVFVVDPGVRNRGGCSRY